MEKRQIDANLGLRYKNPIEDIKKGHFKKPSQNINYKIAHIHVEHCIGCTICIKVCPVDAILGAKLTQHHIISEYCNGCELCINECPTECMTMIDNPVDQTVELAY